MSEPCYISLFHDKLIQNNGELDVKVLINPEPNGCITSRPYKIFYRPTLTESIYTSDMVYFMDFLCVKRERDIKNINRQLLQTHEYNQRTKNPNVLISLIKKEIDLFEGIIPLVKYKTVSYYIPVLRFTELPPDFQIIRIESSNISVLTDYLYNITHNNYKDVENMFDFCILQDTSYYLSLINKGIIHIYCLKMK